MPPACRSDHDLVADTVSPQDDSLELDPRKAQALEHPVRKRIVNLLERGAVKSPMASADLAAALSFYFRDVKLKNLAYHVAVLQRVDLMPKA